MNEVLFFLSSLSFFICLRAIFQRYRPDDVDKDKVGLLYNTCVSLTHSTLASILSISGEGKLDKISACCKQMPSRNCVDGVSARKPVMKLLLLGSFKCTKLQKIPIKLHVLFQEKLNDN
ncbi:hypothetical protein RF11_03005 [Thelohanellus kitauei]|uniref:Uncharacterized protein n=1 Tax=Thelohanellus kitauei TaxID=669202 RepID=A0A0C2IRU3_THEKT|nr:hypothetical protein RF11_03005 [Thelohanellus kitauei]